MRDFDFDAEIDTIESLALKTSGYHYAGGRKSTISWYWSLLIILLVLIVYAIWYFKFKKNRTVEVAEEHRDEEKTEHDDGYKPSVNQH